MESSNIAEILQGLAQAQDEEDILKGIRYLETMAGLYGPEVSMAVLDPYAFGKWLSGELNLPTELRPNEQ